MNKFYQNILLIMVLVCASACEITDQTALKPTTERTPAGQTVPGGTPKPSVPTPSPTPVPGVSGTATPLWESKHADGKNWSAHVMNKLDTLGIDMLGVLPADYATFCKNYPKFTYTQRKEFWTFLISAMVKYESNFKPQTFYTEDFDDSNGDPVVSRGLLQISIESANSYDCSFRSTQELHDAYLNLNCGIRILNRWVGQRDLRIAGKVDSKWRGGARYWSVLRTTSGSYSSIVSLAKNTALCSQ